VQLESWLATNCFASPCVQATCVIDLGDCPAQVTQSPNCEACPLISVHPEYMACTAWRARSLEQAGCDAP